MKTFLTLIAAATLTACGTTQPPPVVEKRVHIDSIPTSSTTSNTTTDSRPTIYKLKGFEGPEAMSAEEVRQAHKHCILSKMQPFTQYLTVRVDTGSKIQVPIGVVCEAF